MPDVDNVYTKVAPYIVHLKEIKSFLEKSRHLSADILIREIKNKITESKNTLKTDFKILLSVVDKPGNE